MRSRILLAGALALVAPLALVLNELFGMPPAFTPAVPEPLPFTGVWSSPAVTVVIDPDGSVFGVSGQEQIYRAKVTHNRTWVGRLLNWRTDYIITGQAGQHRFTAPFNVRDDRIEGALFLFSGESKPAPTQLVLERKS